MTDLRERADRLDTYLAENDLDAVWFGRPNGFAWLTGGSNVVDRDAPVGVAAAGYLDGEFRAITDTIEAERLADEELPEGFTVESFDWYASDLASEVAARSPTPAAADFDVPGFGSVDAPALRTPLGSVDVDRYRDLGQRVGRALEAVARDASPDDTERKVAAALRRELTASGVKTPVALVGGERRAQRYRHYTPTDARLGGYALLSVTAERGGLYASATRTVAFEPPEWLDERHEAAARVEATALAATRAVAEAGGTAADVFDAIRGAYDAVGHPGEWERHHQGGAAGFAGREWIATPTLDTPVRAPMAYSWNPTVQGAKSEDTELVTADGFESLTATGDWPTVTVDPVGYEGSFERRAPLYR